MADTQKNPLGPTGQRVQSNVQQLREAQRISYRELSDRLREIERPIPTLGLSRIEKGERRVDADDLVALGLALDVAPNRLLLTGDAGSDPIQLTPNMTVPSAGLAWRWACGENRLPVPLESGPSTMAESIAFMANSRPHQMPATNQEFRQHRDQLATVADAVRAAEKAGVPFRTILSYLRHTNAVDATGGE